MNDQRQDSEGINGDTKHGGNEGDDTNAKQRKRYKGDYAAYERSTPSQEIITAALIARLQREGIAIPVFTNVRFAMRTNAVQGIRHCVRAADLALIKPGFIIEVDGSAHDRVDKR